MEEKETPLEKVADEAAAYLEEFIKECKIDAITDYAVNVFLTQYICLKMKWLIESLLIGFLGIFLIILVWKAEYMIEVRTFAKVLASAGIYEVFNYVLNSSKIKHLNDVVKLEVSFFKKHQQHIRLKEDQENGRGQAE